MLFVFSSSTRITQRYSRVGYVVIHIRGLCGARRVLYPRRP